MNIGLNEVEDEIVFLKAIQEIIDSMVNFEVLELIGVDQNFQILFKSITHQKFFNVILVDFLSCTDKDAPVNKKSYLSALKSISEKPHFNFDNSVNLLAEATNEFTVWLEQEVEIKIWLSSIDKETTQKLMRKDYLKMCGNISKHNFLRHIQVVKQLRKIIENSGISINIEDTIIISTEFYQKFHEDIFNYHSSIIVEFLNNIRWEIYKYLQPQLKKSIISEGDGLPKYRYNYPETVIENFSKQCYWELMNEMRNPPYVPLFQTTKYLKERY